MNKGTSLPALYARRLPARFARGNVWKDYSWDHSYMPASHIFAAVRFNESRIVLSNFFSSFFMILS